MRLEIDGSRLRADAELLVRTPSVTGQEHEVVGVVTQALRDIGVDDLCAFDVPLEELCRDEAFPGVETARSSFPGVWAELRGDLPGPRVLLLGHVDVVPVGDPESWSTPPFDPAWRDGSLFGRGACDMKAGVAVALGVFRAYAKVPRERRSGTLIFAAVSSEEDGGGCCLAALRRGLRADCCIIPEPTGFADNPRGSADSERDEPPPALVVAHAGAVTLRVTVRGKSAHASSRRDGVCALGKLCKVYEALYEAERVVNAGESNEQMRRLGLPYPTSVGVVRGGDWPSTVMDKVTVDVRVGVALGEAVDAAVERTRAALRAGTSGDDWLAQHPPEVEVLGGRFGAASVPASCRTARTVAACHTQVHGVAPTVRAVPFGCDMRLLVGVGGIETVVYGPGMVCFAHAVDERVQWRSVCNTAEVVARAAAGLLAGGVSGHA